MNTDISLEQAILDQLSAPVKTKQGTVLVDDNGNPISVTKAIAMSITQNAMRGDLAAASFIRNMTRGSLNVQVPKKEYAERIKKAASTVRQQLEGEGLWTGQEVEIGRIASILVLIQDLEDQMHLPGYDAVVTEYTKSGGETRKENPINQLLERYVKQLDERMKEIRQEARIRIQAKQLIRK